VDANGRSAISYEDYAAAMIDEIEKPQFINKHFTAGY
jgi:putative NADH-flavin reductase